MTTLVGAAVALGVAYACVVPWFHCHPNTPEEESRARNNQESDADDSAGNQTLTSTHIRITGLRGLNFVSIMLPNQPSASGVSGHSLQTSSRMNIRQTPDVQNPIITYPDLPKKSTIPQIRISSASTETTSVYPLSSMTSLPTTTESLRMNQSNSTQSNKSKFDVIRSHDIDDQHLMVRRMSRPKIRKPPRAHLPNSRSSHNSVVHNQDSLSSLNTLNGIEMLEKKSLDENKTSTGRFIERRSARKLSKPSEIISEKLLGDEIRRHSLYPDVNVIAGRHSSETSFSSTTNIYKNSEDIIEKHDLTSEYITSSPKIMESHFEMADNFPSTVDNSERISEKSRNKSAFSNFIAKKCKKFWMNVNKNNCENSMKSKCSMELGMKNNPTGHSTFIEKSNLSGEVQGHLNQFKCKSEMTRGHFGDCHDENKNMSTKSHMYYKRHLVSRGIPLCCLTPNLHDEKQTVNAPSTFSDIYSQMEITNHRSSPNRSIFQSIDDEPLDLSTKSKANRTKCHNSADKYSNNNCTSESSFVITIKKSTNFILSKTFNKKCGMKKKCHSLPGRDEMSILKSISNFCHRSQENNDETMKTHLDDSTNYPELKSIRGNRQIFSSGFHSN